MKMKTILFSLSFLAATAGAQTPAALPNSNLNSIPAPAAPARPTAPNSDDLQLVNSVRDQIRAKVWGVPLEKYSISSVYGQVTIQGQAQDLTEAQGVLSAARATSGVKTVVNQITVPQRY